MIGAARTSCRKASGDLKSNISQGWSLQRSCRHLRQPRKSCRWPPTFGDPSGKRQDLMHCISPTLQSTTGFGGPGSKTSRAGIQEQQAMAWGRWVQKFPRAAAVRKSTSVRSFLGGENVRPACQSEGNGWQRQASCYVLQGLFFFTHNQKFWLSHIHEETPLAKHPPCSTRQVATQQRSGLTYQSRSTEKQPLAIMGRSSSTGWGLIFRAVCLQERGGSIVQRGDVP